MLFRSPLPKPVLDVILSSAALARQQGAGHIQPLHILAAINLAATNAPDAVITPERSCPSPIPLAAPAKLALSEAIRAAGKRRAVSIDHLRAACSR